MELKICQKDLKSLGLQKIIILKLHLIKKFLGLMFHPERKNKDQLLINTLINKFIK